MTINGELGYEQTRRINRIHEMILVDRQRAQIIGCHGTSCVGLLHAINTGMLKGHDPILNETAYEGSEHIPEGALFFAPSSKNIFGLSYEFNHRNESMKTARGYAENMSLFHTICLSLNIPIEDFKITINKVYQEYRNEGRVQKMYRVASKFGKTPMEYDRAHEHAIGYKGIVLGLSAKILSSDMFNIKRGDLEDDLLLVPNGEYELFDYIEFISPLGDSDREFIENLKKGKVIF